MKNPPLYDLTAVPGGFLQRIANNDDSLDLIPGYDLEISATKFVLVDPTDRTKKLVFDLSNLATGQSQTYGGFSRQLVHVAADGAALTAARSNRLILLDTAGIDYTLPAISAADDGLTFNFYGEVASTSQSVVAAAGDFLAGGLDLTSDSIPTADSFAANGSSHLTIALNGTTTGGAIAGSFFTVRARGDKWWVSGKLLGTGTPLATPFS